MKLMVIGFGQCGGRLADEFARLNITARRSRGVNVLSGAFAADSDTIALASLRTISHDLQQRIVIGEAKLRGHGLGKRSELGAQIAAEESFKLIDAIRQSKQFSETDAFLLAAGAAGGLGSGALPAAAKLIKERYADRPVYALLVLPFEHEETLEERTVYNAAVCLQAVQSVTDAVFLADNQRYVRKSLSLGSNIDRINKLIVEPFYNLLCTGEQKRRRHTALSVLDAGEIAQTLSGWTAIGYGKSLLHLITLPWDKTRDFKKKANQVQKGIKATDEALSELSVQCNAADAARALFLVSAPEEEMDIDLVKNLGDHLRSIAPEATIRYGDYPTDRGLIDVTVVLSALREVPKVTSYLARSADMAREIKAKSEAQAPPPAMGEAEPVSSASRSS